MKHLYIGCSLNGLGPMKRQKLLAKINRLKRQLGEHFKIVESPDNHNHECSRQESHAAQIKNHIGKADFMLAIVDHQSTELGYEIAAAHFSRKIPVLIVADIDSGDIHYLIQGAPTYFCRYDSFAEIARMTVNAFLKQKLATEA